MIGSARAKDFQLRLADDHFREQRMILKRCHGCPSDILFEELRNTLGISSAQS